MVRNTKTRLAQSAGPALADPLNAPTTDGATDDSGDGTVQAPAVPFDACSPPTVRTPPQFEIFFRRPLVLTADPLGVVPGKKRGAPATWPIAGTNVTAGTVVLGLDPLFQQTWNLTGVTIGDLAYTMGVAPLEQLTLQVQSSQRRSLTQDSMDSTESTKTDEATTSDKEAVNVTRASTTSQNWHVDATASVSAGPASLSVNAGYSKSVTDSNMQAMSHISDTTRKSAQALKSVHKISVSGTTDTTVTNAQTRTFRNPYFDRTLTVNVFHLLKQFSIATSVFEVRAALLFSVNSIQFDSDFVLNNADFLRATLLDSSLYDGLSAALQGAMPVISLSPDARTTGSAIARSALHFLFDDTNVFNMPKKGSQDPNKISTSFNASLKNNGLGDALNNHLGEIFVVANAYYFLFQQLDANGMKIVDSDPDTAIRMAASLGQDLGKKWSTLYPDVSKAPASSDIPAIFDNNQFTEIFRRVPGFVSMVTNMLAPLVSAAQQAEDAETAQALANYTLSRLIGHLTTNQNFYIQKYLLYIAANTHGQAIIDFAAAVLSGINLPPGLPNGDAVDFNVQGAFVDGQQIVVPAYLDLTPDEIGTYGQVIFNQQGSPVENPDDIVVEIEVPCDGVHVEVSPGACVLPNVPPVETSFNFNLQGLTITAGPPA